MMLHKYWCFFIFFFSLTSLSYAQYITVDDTYTAQQLVQNVLLNSGCANVSNISVTSSQNSVGNGYGFFDRNGSTFPFQNGIILSSGNATSAVGPNSSLLSEGGSAWVGDADLEQALSISGSINATIIEFDFVPLTTNFSFDYIFSSEQYLTNPTSNQCNFTDGFAFLLKKANSSDPYINLALVPNTSIPVKVNTVRGSGTVCPAANEEYFGGFNADEHPTNFNGQTVVLKATSAVIANEVYHIKLVIADQGNSLYDSAIFLGGGSFKSTTNIGQNRLIATNNPLCENETLVLTANESGATAYQWYKNGSILNGETSNSYTITSAGNYVVEISIGNSNCVSVGEIKIEYSSLPIVTSPVDLVECDADTDGITVFNLTKLNSIITQGNTQLNPVVYFLNQTDAQNNVNAIQNPASFLNTTTNTLVAKISNAYGCTSYASVNLQIANTTLPNINPINICDEDGVLDGKTTIDLTLLVTSQLTASLPSGLVIEYYSSINDAVSQTNQLSTNFTNTTAFNQTIYARIVNGPDCYGIISVNLTITSFNPPNFNDETVIICENVPEIVSVATGFSSYLWNNGATTSSIIVDTSGNYSVTVTNSLGCKATKNFNVIASSAPIISFIEVLDFSGNNNTITINVTGNGDYEYSIDGINYQSSPTFTGVASGQYLAYVNDKNFCGNDTKTFTVLDYPRFFTPNNDGENDTWLIPNLTSGTIVTIFDRYGKVVYAFTGNQSGWNGKQGNIELFSTDYWFSVTLENNRIIKGHFSLKR